MANIPKVDGNFDLEVNNATQSYEDTLYTDNKVISGDIHIHITAKSGVLNNTPTSGITYTEDTSQQSVLPSEGALYLNEGYYQNTKITLDHMLPDPSGTYTNPGTNDIRAGRKAYDGSGKLIVGTMADVTPGFNGGTPSLTNTTNTITTNMATASSGTYKINAVAKAKATRTKVSYNNDYTGYLDKASGTEASAAATSAEGSINAVTIYIKDASPSAEVSSLSVPSVEVSGAVTGMTTASSGNYYIQINATKTDGSVKAKYKNTQEGYAPANTGSESGASAITPSVNGSGTKIYIKSCTITNNTSGGSSSGTINRGSQIKIGQGYNASDKYYTAQANSGTKTITTNGVESCDGYASVDIQVPTGITPVGTITITKQTGTDVTNYASANVQGATINSPVASKGAVSNNQVIITPSYQVTQAGWVGAGTVNGNSITVKASDLVGGTITITSQNGTNVTNYASANVRSATYGATLVQGAVSNHQVVITPSVSVSQAGWAGSGKTGTSIVVKASDLVSGTLNVTGYGTYDCINYASVSVPEGTEGSPIATKGAVSNHKVVITPKVTNAGGYIAGGTITGATIEVSASELVSGTITLTQQNGTDVTNYSSANVQSATPSFSGGVASITNSSSTYSTNMEEDQESTYYVSVQASAKATRNSVIYNGAVSGWVEKANGAEASASNTSEQTLVANVVVPIKELVLPNATTGSAPSGYSSVQTIDRSTSIRRIIIPAGYHASNEYYTISSVANGSFTGPTNTTTYSTLAKEVTPSSEVQYVNYSAGYTTSRYIKINAIPRKRYNILSTKMGSSCYYKISGAATIYIYKGTYTNTITVKDTIIKLSGLSNATSSLTLSYSIINKNGTSSDLVWSDQTLAVSGSGSNYGCYILTSGEISFSLSAPTYHSLTSSTTLPSPYALNTAYRTASAIRLYTYAYWNGSGTSSYKWINASYFKITSISKTTASSGYNGYATINASYSDDGVTWTEITCSASKGGSSSASISSSVGISFFDIVDDILLEPDSYE